MKYGAWGKIPFTIKNVPIKKGKKQSERKKDINKLKKSFPNISLLEIERVYCENNENIEDSILNLSSFEVAPSENSSELNQKIELLEEMFDGMEDSYIREVYSQCDQNISQTTAFLLESTTDDTLTSDENFGNVSIGYVNKDALKRRAKQSFGEMLVESFPQINRKVVYDVYESCNHDMLEAFHILGSLPRVEYEEKEEIKETPGDKYNKEYPSLINVPQTKTIRKGVWAKDANNHFLEGNNLDAVKKIKILMSSFPAIDDVTVKEIFFQMGDDLGASIAKLKELFPKYYREIPTEETIYIPHPQTSQWHKTNIPECEDIEYEKITNMSDRKYNEQIEIMQRSRMLHDTLFQAASNAAASGNFIDAKKLTIEGKKHQNIFRESYLNTYRETFQRNNEKCAEDTIDLHGLQAEEALLMLENYLKRAKNVCRKVEVITVRNS